MTVPVGPIAQLGECYNGIVEVKGSSPFSSTKRWYFESVNVYVTLLLTFLCFILRGAEPLGFHSFHFNLALIDILPFVDHPDI